MLSMQPGGSFWSVLKDQLALKLSVVLRPPGISTEINLQSHKWEGEESGNIANTSCNLN